ncbi:MAG TPA: TetR family transcriptional regulator [Solirubrobacteraceae bacterium]|jgi:AcrR family transcriptional regulator|nr:TetR family transcriptional regulator [Solirubrobacteraceae bacterium]
MSSLADNATTTRRRHDAQASRQALLEAADALFDERGYDAATVRDIGDRAAVDPALIARYFGSKEGLYLATLEREPRTPLPADLTRALEHILSRSEQRGIGPIPLAMVSPTHSDELRAQVSQIIGRRLVAPFAAQLAAQGAGDVALRAEILVAVAIGVSLTRAGGTLPALARAPLADVVAVLETVIGALAQDGS